MKDMGVFVYNTGATLCVGFKVNGRYEESITEIAIKGASVKGTLSLDAGAKLIITVDGMDREVKLDGKEWKAGERYSCDI